MQTQIFLCEVQHLISPREEAGTQYSMPSIST